MDNSQKPILVSGATGFVASHVIKLLLEQGYKVRGTVRSLANKSKSDFLYTLAPEKNANLELVEADLLKPATWPAAAEGVDYILHVASPFPNDKPKDEMEVIRPAVEGTLNILEAAVEKGVKKVILTSSVVAIMYGHEDKISGPEDWSVEKECDAYAKSKTRAEKAAWDFWKKHEGKFELATVNPGFVLGPVFVSSGGTSEEVVADFLKGAVPAVPKMMMPVVDVREVAECHIRALKDPNSNGKRFICSAASLWMKEFCDLLREEFEKYGYSIPKRELGKCLLKIGSIFIKKARSLVSEVDKERRLDASMSVKELGINYRSPKESLAEMGYSLIKLGIVPDKVNKPVKKC